MNINGNQHPKYQHLHNRHVSPSKASVAGRLFELTHNNGEIVSAGRVIGGRSSTKKEEGAGFENVWYLTRTSNLWGVEISVEISVEQQIDIFRWASGRCQIEYSITVSLVLLPG